MQTSSPRVTMKGMKGLSPRERALVSFLNECPPNSCPGPGVEGAEPLSPDQRAALDPMVKATRARVVECPCGCGAWHALVTPEGLLAYQLDSLTKG